MNSSNKHIQWIATEIDDLSLLLRVQKLDRIADILGEALDALDETLDALQVARSDAHAPPEKTTVLV
jgi:hypothetical protein